MTTKPNTKPNNPLFSSGPCAKRPGWTPDALKDALIGRSHRAAPGKKKLQAAIEGQRKLLGIPADYKVGIVPASDTGAVEMALWSLLGERGVDLVAWESFGMEWLKDVTSQLKLKDVREFTADYGQIPDLNAVDTDRDVVFTWNGTTSGVKVPNGDWIKADRKGLTICDATSAVCAYDMPWDKLDVVTWSWQKVLGGEAAHGMLVLSPRAVARLESYKPAWPLPKIFRMTKKDKDGNIKLQEDIFEGATINTPSMLCVEDCLDALKWAETVGGLQGLMKRCDQNLATIAAWVEKSDWIDFLPVSKDIRSSTSICLKVKCAWFNAQPKDAQEAMLKALVKMMDEENVGKDIGSYRDAPGGLRIWGGATVENADIAALLPWLDYGYATLKAQSDKAAA